MDSDDGPTEPIEKYRKGAMKRISLLAKYVPIEKAFDQVIYNLAIAYDMPQPEIRSRLKDWLK